MPNGGVVPVFTEAKPESNPPATAAKLPPDFPPLSLVAELAPPTLLDVVEFDIKAGILALLFPVFLSFWWSFRLSLAVFLLAIAEGWVIAAVSKEDAEDEPANFMLAMFPPV